MIIKSFLRNNYYQNKNILITGANSCNSMALKYAEYVLVDNNSIVSRDQYKINMLENDYEENRYSFTFNC